MIRTLAILALGFGLVPQTGGATVYQIDPAHTSINFAVRHLVISTVRGRFTDFSGAIQYDDKDVAKSSVEFTAKIASINTDVPQRDEDLRGANFFDAAKYPDLSFKSSKVEKHGDQLVCTGTLTIKGVAKQVEIPFKLSGPITDPWGNTRIGVEGALTINRQDYGIAYDRKLPDGGLVVGNDVRIDLDVEGVHKPAK